MTISAMAQEPVEILSADVLDYDKPRLGDIKRFIGNVGFKQKDLLLYCDSAYFNESKNTIQAFNNVRIFQGDSTKIYGDHLNYDGNTKIAILTGKNVSLTDGQIYLQTEALQYDAKNKTGFYTNGATITSGINTLKSVKGTYHVPSKIFGFRKNVELYNPEYKMVGDTFQYHQYEKIAYFFGPTFIFSTDSTTIYCENGWFNTQTNSSQFSKNSYVKNPTQFLTADSMTYSGQEKVDRAFRNIILVDTINKIEIRGDYGVYYRDKNMAKITKNPIAAMQNKNNDTTFIVADTLKTVYDTIRKNRILYAYHGVKMWQIEFQAVSDSMYYSVKDSMIKLETNPIIWSDKNQVSADSISLFLKDDLLNKMFLKQNVFIASLDTVDRYNQIKGKNAIGYFVENKFKKIDIEGNGESVYYIKENADKYIGVNKIICSNMTIIIDSNTVKQVQFYLEPSGTLYPLDKAPKEELKLRGFKWHYDKKPNLIWNEKTNKYQL